MPKVLDLIDALSKAGAKAGTAEAAVFGTNSVHDLIPSIVKIPEDPDPTFFARIAGVPTPFLQLGTKAGLTGVPALTVDVLTDPFTYLGGILNLTKFGKGARAVSTFGRTARGGGAAGQRIAKELSEELAANPGLTSDELIKRLGEQIGNAGRFDVSDLDHMRRGLVGKTQLQAEDFLRKFRDEDLAHRFQALEGGTFGVQSLSDVSKNGQIKRAMELVRKDGPEVAQQKLLREVQQREAIRLKGLQFAQTNDFRGLQKTAREIRKLDPSARSRDLLGKRLMGDIRSLMEVSRGQRRIAPLGKTLTDQAAARIDGMKAAQRALVTFRVPFTGAEFSVPLGQKLAGGLDAVGKTQRFKSFSKPFKDLTARQGGGLIKGARLAAQRADELFGGLQHTAGVDSMADMGIHAAEALGPIIKVGGPEDFQNISRLRNAEIQNAVAKGHIFGREMFETIEGAGFNNKKDLDLLQDLTEKPSLYLNQADDLTAVSVEGGRLAAGRFGKTGIFGSINAAGKKAGVTDKHREIAEALDVYYRSARKILEDEGVEANFKHNFATRAGMIRVKDQAEYKKRLKAFVPKALKTDAPQFRERSLGEIDEVRQMEKDGIIEIIASPVDLAIAYSKSAGEATATGRFIRRMSAANEARLTTLTDEAAEKSKEATELPFFLSKSKHTDPKMKKLLEANEDLYIETNEPAITTLANEMGLVPDPSKSIWVKKSIAQPLKAILASPTYSSKAIRLNSEKWMDAALTLNAASKRSLLLFSGFHYMALTESAVADLGSEFFKQGPRAIRRGMRDFWQASDVLEGALRDGVQVGPIMDVERDAVQRAIKWAERAIPVASPAVRGFGKAVMTWDKGLWDYYHNGLKLNAYHELKLRAFARHPKGNHQQIGSAIGEHVNNAFGGQVWEHFWTSKRGLRIARLFQLAPDWTISNLRIAMDVFANGAVKNTPVVRRLLEAGTGFPVSTDDLLRADVRSTFARQYALRAGLIFMVAANLMNFAMTGHFMDQNEEGHRSQIQMPWKDENGRNQYLRFGKQFREPWELLNVFEEKSGPLQFLKRKLSPVAKQSVYQIFSQDQFGNPLVGADDSPIVELGRRAGMVFGGTLPIPLQEAFFRGKGRGVLSAALGTFGLPIKKGKRASAQADIPSNAANAIGDLLTDRVYTEELRRVQDASSSRKGLNLAPLGALSGLVR